MQEIIYRQHIQDYAQHMDQAVIDYLAGGQVETYESFGAYSLLVFDWYDLSRTELPPSQIMIYIDRDDLFFICENEVAHEVVERFFTPVESNEQSIYLFFRDIFAGSTKYVELLERRVAMLDDDVTDGTEAGLRERIIALRNEILRAKKFYEQLEFLLADMCDNDNGLFSAASLRFFTVLHNRSQRLVSQTGNLREYITQVRESYQAQIGIEQNALMKVFTLVTSIFLPLTLIAGWYGMNLRMPEFAWRHGYLFVAGLCLAVCLIWFLVFRKKKWFK